MSGVLTSVSIKFTEDELKKTLKRISGCDEIVVVSLESGSGSEKKGDSYLSSIYRFTINAIGKLNDKEEMILLHVIAKGIPRNVARRKTFRSVDFFETEINFYNNVWPLMKELKDSKNINEPDEVPLLLSCFSDGEQDYIALKDLSFDGYSTVQRGSGITMEYALMFLKLLANFHALSIAARDQNPEFEKIARSLKETYFHERFRGWYSEFQQGKLYEVIRKAVRIELDPVYLKKVDNLFSRDYFGLLCNLAKGVPSKLLAVTQGDVWIPNFLGKMEEGKPRHGILIDFQLARYGSITSDLIHFLYSCISQEVLLSNWDDLVVEYHQYLSHRLAQLGSNKNLITLVELTEDIQKNSHIGLAMAMESTVMSMLGDDEVPDLDTIEGEEAVPLETVWDISPFEDVQRNRKVAFIIKHAIDKGLF